MGSCSHCFQIPARACELPFASSPHPVVESTNVVLLVPQLLPAEFAMAAWFLISALLRSPWTRILNSKFWDWISHPKGSPCTKHRSAPRCRENHSLLTWRETEAGWNGEHVQWLSIERLHCAVSSLSPTLMIRVRHAHIRWPGHRKMNAQCWFIDRLKKHSFFLPPSLHFLQIRNYWPNC